jgi:NTE family protein
LNSETISATFVVGKTMKAYAILDGGGVKGAALVGALYAAEQNQIEWLGYGGTSAGAIVATLACVGFTAAELRAIVVDRPFSDLLDDGTGDALEDVRKSVHRILDAITAGDFKAKPLRTICRLSDDLHRLNGVTTDLGLYSGDRLREWLRGKILEKKGTLSNANEITFEDLNRVGCRPLKIVASNISHKSAVIYPDDTGDGESVLNAVRASVCYPFVFHPVRQDPRRLVDGGLCSNLPAFLFDDEAKKTRAPIIAIDLVPKAEIVQTPPPGLARFLSDMVDTALEGSQKLLRDRIRNLHHVRIEINPPIGATEFKLEKGQRDQLFQNGIADFHSYYAVNLKPLFEARNQVQRLQSLYASPDLVVPLLGLVARTVEASTKAKRVRANVMLPTLGNERIVVYQYGMDGMSDRTLKLSLEGGCSGAAFTSKSAAYADLEEALQDPTEYGLTQDEQDLVPHDLKSMISLPLLDTSELSPADKTVRRQDLPVVGTLNVDTITSGVEADWVAIDPNGDVKISGPLLDFLNRWADIITKVLT